MKAETLICNKNNLSKIIKWSTSKYNEYSKREVVNEIAELFKRRDEIEHTMRLYTTGSYSEKGHQNGKRYGGSNGWKYRFVIKNGAATLEDVYSGIIYFLKDRRKINSDFRTAKSISAVSK